MKYQVFYNLLDRIAKLAVPFVISILAARTMDKDVFGVFVYITILIASALTIVGGGVDTIFSKEIAKTKSINSNQLISFIIIRFFLSLILSCAIITNLEFKFSLELEVLFIVFLVCLSACLYFYEILFVSLQLNKLMFLLTAFSLLAFLPLKIYTILMFGEYKFKFLVDVLEYMLIILFSLIILRNHIVDSLKIGSIWRDLKLLLKSAFPLWLNTVFLVLYSRMDMLFIGYVGQEEDIADYSIAINLNALALVIPTVFLTVYFPKMVSWFQENKESYNEKLVFFIRLSVIYGVVWILACNLLSEIIINFIYGTDFKVSSSYLNVLSFTIPFVILGQLLGQHIIITGRYWISLKRSFVGVVFTLSCYSFIFGNVSMFSIAYISVFNVFLVNVLLYLVMKDTKDVRVVLIKSVSKGL